MVDLVQRLPKQVYLYFFCQSINFTAAVISVVVAATVGSLIAPAKIVATLPYGVQFLCLFIATYPVSWLMEQKGRKFGFVIGALLLASSGVVGFIATNNHNFLLLILSHGLLGLFTACANYYRFAVTDGLAISLKSKALSLVVAGGVVAGFIGPAITAYLKDVSGFEIFSLCYAFLTLLAIINLIFIFFLPNHYEIKKTEKTINKNIKAISIANLFANHRLVVAIVSSAFGYGLMNLMMIQSSLYMNHTGVTFEESAFAIQWHVVAMFFPSFFSGWLIGKFGHRSIIIAGFLLFLISFTLNLYWTEYLGIFISLFILGLAWNFSYVGGSALLAVAIATSSYNSKWQGVGDTLIAVFAMFGAFAPSLLLATIGWQYTNIVSIVFCLIVLSVVLLLKTATPKEACNE